jgi:hypothetical protein
MFARIPVSFLFCAFSLGFSSGAFGQSSDARGERAAKPRPSGIPERVYPFVQAAQPIQAVSPVTFPPQPPSDPWRIEYRELQGEDAAVNPSKPLTPEDRQKLEAKIRYRTGLLEKGGESSQEPAARLFNPDGSLRSQAEPSPSVPIGMSSGAATPASPYVDAEGAATYSAGNSSVPDGAVAVSGNGYVVTQNNTHVQFFDANANVIYSGDEDTFWAPLEPTANLCDPRIVYDTYNNRFVMMCQHGNSSSNTELYIAFSLSSNPMDGWWYYDLDANPGDSNLWFDYPYLAYNGENIVITGNMFTNGGSFQETKVFLFDSGDGYAGSVLDWGYFDNVEHNGSSPFHCGALSYPMGGYGPGFYLWSKWDTDEFLLSDVSGDLDDNPTLSTFLISSPYTNNNPPSAPQQGSTQTLTIMSDVQSVYYGGDGKIYYAFAYGDGNGNSRLRLGRYNVGNENHAQWSFGAEGWDYGFPTLSPWASSSATFNGESVVGFLRVSSDTYPEFRVSVASPTDGWSPSVGVKSGETPLDQSSRWGDYIGSGYHENTGHKESWIYGIYGRNNDHGLWVAQVVDELYGCTDANACNYDATATASDGTCEYTSCIGCTDPEACNFDVFAEENDGSCTYPGCTDFGACNYSFAAGCDDGSCCYDYCLDLDMSQGFPGLPPFSGSSLLSYSIVNNGTGTVVASGSNLAPHHDFCLPAGCYTITFAGAAGATWSLERDPVFFLWGQDYTLGTGTGPGSLDFQLGNGGAYAGCTDANACNYNAQALCDNGTCCYATCIVVDMEDSWGDGWNGSVWEISQSGDVVASGTLENGFNGTDKACLNPGCYTFAINTSAGQYAYEVSWTVSGASEGLFSGTSTTTGSFTVGDGGEDAGCTDDAACNFDPYATCDDGSCCFANCGVLNMTDSWGDGWNGAVLTLASPEGMTTTYTLPTGQAASQELCLTSGCYDVEVTPGIYPSEVGWSLAFGNYVIQGGAPHDDFFSIDAVFGCTVEGACNFNPEATCNLGLCTFPGCLDPEACTYNPAAGCSMPEACYYGCLGCTYPDALNFNPEATTDDGSCEFTSGSDGCSTDVNGDGIVNVGDLLLLLGDFGVICTGTNP